MDIERSDIIKYIKTEKDISRFKIKILEKSKNISKSKKRLLDIEREFVSLSLEDWPFEDVADVASAISIYRSSRALFYKTYNFPKPKELTVEELKAQFFEKKLFINNIKKKFLTSKVEELNLVQNEELFFKLAQYLALRGRKSLQVVIKDLEQLSLYSLNNIAPITIGKERARKQATIYSIGLFLKKELKNLNDFDLIENKEFFIRMINRLDLIVDNLDKNIFKYYNLSLNKLNKSFSNNMGYNDCFSKVHKLKNILDFKDLIKDFDNEISLLSGESIGFDQCLIKNIYFDSKKIIGAGFSKEKSKNSKTKTFGILLPISRLGNEKMTLMHTHIYAHGKNISTLFEENISNVKVLCNNEQIYFKALMLRPFWELIDSYNNKEYKDFLINMINFNFDNIEELDIKKNIDLINKNKFNEIKIDNQSVAFCPKTRSEEDAFSDIIPWAQKMTYDIKKEYYIATNVNH